MKTLIKNAILVWPDGSRAGSLVIEDQRIADLDPARHTTADETIDATGLHLLPGLIDAHVHFREPGLTHKEDLRTATRACAKGGVTSFLEMPNTRPSTTTCALLAEKLELAAGKSLVNYGFYIGATPHNLAELQEARRTPGIKIFMGSSTGDLLVDRQEDLERIFAETILPIAMHCEDEETVRRNAERLAESQDVSVHSLIRDHQAAIIAARRALDLASRHQHPLHILHVSTAAEAHALAQRPPWVTAEVCPHHLLFSCDDYNRLGTLIQINPALKTPADQEQLWQALHAGDIQTIGTDHAPHTLEEKARPYPQSPSGLPAVENSLALMLDQAAAGRCTVEQLVRWMCQAPAEVWNIPRKGRLEIGYDADLVLVDIRKQRQVRNEEQQTKCGWSPWHGVTLTGWPVRTWVMGHQVYCDGRFDTSRCGHEVEYGERQKA